MVHSVEVTQAIEQTQLHVPVTDAITSCVDDAMGEELLDELPVLIAQPAEQYLFKDRTPAKPTREDWEKAERQLGRTFFPRQGKCVAESIELIDQMLTERGQPPAPDYLSAILPQRVRQSMKSESEFQAGALHRNAEVWKQYLHRIGAPPQETKEVVGILNNGVALQWCHALDTDKVAETRHKQRQNGVRMLLQQVGKSPAAAEEMLKQPHPDSITLPNRFSCEEHQQFAREQIAVNVQRGVLIEWPWEDTKPWIMSPLSVVANSVGKLRLIMDARYLNLFLKRLKFKYETAVDALRLLLGENWAWTIDFTAGYHHLLLQQEDWAFLGCQFEGKIYVHGGLAFGVSQAPAIFTLIVQLAMFGLRNDGETLTGMIDDSLGAAAELQVAAKQMGTQMVILAALGWMLSARKCLKSPAKIVEYLGFQFNLTDQKVYVPEAKLQRLLTALDHLKEQWTETAHRKIAGQLAAMALALPFSPLLVRALRYESDEGLKHGVLGMELREFLAKRLPQLNGRPWDAAVRVAAVLVVDTSETATGAFLEGFQWQATLPFDAADLQRMAQGTFSSTEREVEGILRSLVELKRTGMLKRLPMQAVQVVCDNQGAVSALTYLRGGPTVFPAVANTHLWALDNDVALSFVWQPRSTAAVMKADGLSKTVDHDDWRLSSTVFSKQVQQQQPDVVTQGFLPVHCDLFGSRHAHIVDNYYSREWDGKSLGQDAMTKDWTLWPKGMQPDRAGQKPVMYAFPPWQMLQLVLLKIHRERPVIWVVCSRYLRAADELFLKQMPVRGRVNLNCRANSDIVKPTVRNPAKVAGGRWYTPLQALLISYETTRRQTM